MHLLHQIWKTRAAWSPDDAGGVGDGGASAPADAGAASGPAAAGADTIAAGAGDTLLGGAGADSLTGSGTASGQDTSAAGDDSKAAGDKGADALGLLGAPAGDYILKLPEGSELKLDAKAVEIAGPILKELNISEAGANTLMAKLYVPLMQHAVTSAVEASNAEATARFNTDVAAWAEEAKSDPSFKLALNDKGESNGGFAGGIAEALTHAARFRDAFGGPEIKALLEASGLGNRKEVIMMFAKAGKAIGEGSFHTGDGGSAKPKNDGEAFYGNTMDRQQV